MYYVIQENTFREENYNILVETLDRFNLPYEIVKVRPFLEDFDFKTDRKDVFCFGSVKMSRLAKKYEWYPGSLLNENHDYRVYSKFYKENLLNFDSKIQKFGDEIDLDIFFARPCEDTKTFTGKVFDQFSWKEFKDDFFKSGQESTLKNETEIQISSVKNITKEFRFWIVGEEVVTGSLYRMGSWINRSNIIDDGALEFCKKMAKIYQLADAFVMDICEVIINGMREYKIIECGCINSAGFYMANMPKLIEAIELKWNYHSY
jgi:hypothetical protein